MKAILEHSAIDSFTDSIAAQLDQQQVAVRAYEIYERRGRAEGYDVEDWLTAEREISMQRASPPTSLAA
jgi:hypothetical protein